jgi:O-antigen ligase
MEIIFYFFLVFIYALNFVQIANLIFYVIIIKQCIEDKGRIYFVKNSASIIFFLLYITWVTLTTLFYNNVLDIISDSRIIIQYLFNLQYFVLIVLIKIKIKSFENWIYYFSILLSIVIIYIIVTQGISYDSLRGNEVLNSNIPGYPNSTAIPLLLALWLSFKKEKIIWSKLLFIVALVFTGSRGALLGTLLITLYFGYKKIRTTYYFSIIFSFVLFLLFSAFVYLNSMDSLFISQMVRSYDREDIFNTTMAYVELSPIFGYGGNTIDQLQEVNINYLPYLNWGHTHNWILEILLRYGGGGLLLFLGFIFSIFKSIKDKDGKYMFVVFLFLAFFQTFIRDFAFIFFLSYFANYSTENNIQKKSIKQPS